MSYCRFSPDSDVYVFETFGNKLECCGCTLNPVECFACGTRSEMIQHLELHRMEGHLVSEHALERLWQEQQQFGDTLVDNKEPV